MSDDLGEGLDGSGRRETVVDVWQNAVATYGDRPAIDHAGQRLTFLEVDDLVSRVARSLGRLAPPGARVLLLLPNGLDFCAVLLGALAAGLAVVPTSPKVTRYQLAFLLDDASPAVVVTSGDSSVEVPGRSVVHPEELYEASSSLLSVPTQPRPDDIALLLYTSGTSARPKGILCPHRTVTWVGRAISSMLNYRKEDVVYVRVPMSFDYGLYQLFLCALSGACLALPSGELTASELRHIRASGATVVPVVPSLAELLAKLARRDNVPTSVRLFTNTGESLHSATAANLRTTFPKAALIFMYGMSECKRITIAEPDEDIEHPGTVGRPLPGTQVSIVDENGGVLPAGAIGQLRVSGPHVMAGYHRMSTAAGGGRFIPSRDGVGTDLLTGDYGWLDEQGRFYFQGRRDDIFKRNGLRMSVAEIEEAVAGIPGVQGAASRCPGADGVLTVWVVTHLDERDLREQVAKRLGSQRTPDRFAFLTQLPLTSNGKIDRGSLQEVPATLTNRR